MKPQTIILLLVLIASIWISGFLVIPLAANAQDIALLEPIEGFVSEESARDLGAYLAGIFRLAIGIASGLAVIMIVFGGIQYMTTDSVSGKSEGLQKVESAVFGLVVALVAFLVLQTINPALVRFDIVDTLQRAADEIGRRTPSGDASSPDAIPPEPPSGPPDNMFDFRPASIAEQAQHNSPALATLLSCMSGTVPGNVGVITSISDSEITSGNHTIEECAQNGCAHRAGSCHYGGTDCTGSSYAVDFGDEHNFALLQDAAELCTGGRAFVLFEGNHVHVSIGDMHGCDCN